MPTEGIAINSVGRNPLHKLMVPSDRTIFLSASWLDRLVLKTIYYQYDNTYPCPYFCEKYLKKKCHYTAFLTLEAWATPR